jgi:AraC-like DNA-binding protein
MRRGFGGVMLLITRFIQYIKRNSLVFRTLLLFFIAGTFTMFLVSGLYMGFIKQKYVNETEEKSRQFVEQSYNIAEILLEPLYIRLYQLYQNDDVIITAMYGENLGKADYAAVFTKLREEAKNNSLIRSLYIYNSREDMFFYYFDGASGIVKREEMFDPAAVLMVEDTGGKPIFQPRAAAFTDKYGSLEVDENWFSVFFGLNRGISSPAFIVNIDQDRFQKLVESPMFGEGQQTRVIDRDGIIISNSNPVMINLNVGEDGMYNRIKDSNLASGSFSYHEEGTDYLVSYKKSPSLGWVFIGFGNKSELLKNFNNTQTIMTFISVSFMLISLVVSFFVSKYMYTPLYRLIRTVHEIKHQNDIDLSMKAYDELQNEYLELVSNVKKIESGIERFTEMKARAVAASEAKKSEWVKTTVDYIDTNFSNGNLTVEMIAEYTGLSPNYLRAIFKAAQGISLSKYLTDVRMMYVKKMLLETDKHVHEIAAQAGFMNAKHFYVLFKQYTGLTAEMFRRRGGGGGGGV